MKYLILLLAFLIGCDSTPTPRPPTPLPTAKPTPKPHREEVVVLDFYATWCGPCKRNAPAIDLIERQGTKITRIDIDQDPDRAAWFHITSVPTYVVLENGRETGRTQTPSELRHLLGK